MPGIFYVVCVNMVYVGNLSFIFSPAVVYCRVTEPRCGVRPEQNILRGQRGKIMKKKKRAAKKLLPWALLAAFSALVFYYDENGRIIED